MVLIQLAFDDLQKGLPQRGIGHVIDVMIAVQAHIFVLTGLKEILGKPAALAGGTKKNVIEIDSLKCILLGGYV